MPVETDVLVIGSGIAGAAAALRLAQDRQRHILVVTRAAAPEESNTFYAQGGIVGRDRGNADDTPELLAGDTSGVGYLLKDRVVDLDDFLSAARRVVAGGNAVDAEVVSQLLGRSARRAEVERLTAREQEVLAAMAEGLSNAGIAEALDISEGAVEKHVGNVMAKLGLDTAATANRRVLAVLRYLDS